MKQLVTLLILSGTVTLANGQKRLNALTQVFYNNGTISSGDSLSYTYGIGQLQQLPSNKPLFVTKRGVYPIWFFEIPLVNFTEAVHYTGNSFPLTPGTTPIQRTYNSTPQCIQQDDVDNGARLLFVYNGSGALIQKNVQVNTGFSYIDDQIYTYEYNAAGQTTVIKISAQNNMPISIDSMFYDGSGNMIAKKLYNDNIGSSGQLDLNQRSVITYTGNNPSSFDQYLSPNPGDEPVLDVHGVYFFTGNYADSIAYIDYDAAGTITTDTFAIDAYTYDGSQRLSSKLYLQHGTLVSGQYYAYDADGFVTMCSDSINNGSNVMEVSSTQQFYYSSLAGLAEHLDFDMEIFPNPAQKTVTIVAETPIEYIQVSNLSGQQLIVQKGTSSIVQIDSLPAGTYFLSVSGNGQTATRQFVKH